MVMNYGDPCKRFNFFVKNFSVYSTFDTKKFIFFFLVVDGRNGGKFVWSFLCLLIT